MTVKVIVGIENHLGRQHIGKSMGYIDTSN